MHYGEKREPVDSTASINGLQQRLSLASPVSSCITSVTTVITSPATPPPNFPPSIPLYQQEFQNWSGEIVVDALWTCAPQTAEDVVTVANWAFTNGYRLRPLGMAHNWSPLVVPVASSPSNIILVDTTRHLTTVIISSSGSPATVTAQTGVTMDDLLANLEQTGYGLTATPAPGGLTIGGVLAIDGHGTAIPAQGEVPIPGHTYGSVSNLIVSLTAVIWDSDSNQYVLHTFARSDLASRAMLVHIGRAFITDVTLQIGTNSHLRCQSHVDISAATLFGTPDASEPQTFASFVESTGRVETIWFPFTSNPWMKVWTVSPTKPPTSREINNPYNYVFANSVPKVASDLIAEIIKGDVALTPLFGQVQFDAVSAGLVSTDTLDIWGWSKNLLLYVRSTTLRMTANGYTILTKRNNIQRVVYEFTTFYQSLLTAYQEQGSYPMNGPMEIRVTGLDDPRDIEIQQAGSPPLSAVRPRPDHPEWDVAVWFDVLTIPGTPQADQFYNDLETWVFEHYSGSYAMVRPEWSKGWAYTSSAAWSDPTMLRITIPNAYRAGQTEGDNWDAALAALDNYDPHRIFSNAFLDVLLP